MSNITDLKNKKIAILNILRKYDLRKQRMKDIQRINNKDRLDNYLYIISKDNQKLKKELIEKNLLENGFIEKKVADIELRKVELLEKGLIDEKEFLKKATTFKPKKKKVKGINFKIIYTPMGNKR